MTEAHVMAIADTPVPPELSQETTTQMQKQRRNQLPSLRRNQVLLLEDHPLLPPLHVQKNLPMDQNSLQHLHLEEGGGKDHGGKGSGSYSHRGGDWNYTGYGGNRW